MNGKDRFLFLLFILNLPLLCGVVGSQEKTPPELTATGRDLETSYAETLQNLSEEIVARLPAIDPQKKTVFLNSREALSRLVPPKQDAAPETHKAYQLAREAAEVNALDAARKVLLELQSFLAQGELDSKLMKLAILRHGTPRGLAEFAQQGDFEKSLLDNLFADEGLMKQVLHAGGANGGEYGEAMQVYKAILEASERAQTPGILQRLALGTALHQPWLEGKEKGGVYGVVYTDNQTPDGQVARYLHYEQAFLAGELDPAFKDMTTWECRFISNDPYTNNELRWARQMLRNFRPDHISNPDYSWRYVGMVKSDLPYCSTRNDPALGLPQQQALALGGVCGRRAFFGRFITRAFGIPARRSTQTGHAALNMWTPDGWVVRLGAWWSMNWCGPQGGLDFLLDSQAREFSEYDEVLRLQWLADAIGEEDVSLRNYGQGGGFWNGLAFYHKQAIVEDHEAAALGEELAALTEDEARLLGESDKILNGVETKDIKIPSQFTNVEIAEDGTFVIPAVACTSPSNNTDKVAFLESWDEGMQIHYQRLGNRPEILRYNLELPAAGKYELTAKVATVSTQQGMIFRFNRRTLVNLMLPYTKGSWQVSEPEVVELRKGKNSIMITFRAPNRGVSFKEFRLKAVK